MEGLRSNQWSSNTKDPALTHEPDAQLKLGQTSESTREDESWWIRAGPDFSPPHGLSLSRAKNCQTALLKALR